MIKLQKTIPPSKKDNILSIPEIAIGFDAARALSENEVRLFRTFQSNLLSMISHELRTPLMGVLNAMAILEKNQIKKQDKKQGKNQDKNQRMWIRQAARSAQNLKDTIDLLLGVAEVESGELHMRAREIVLKRVVGAWLKQSQGIFDGMGMTTSVVSEVTKGGSQVIFGDPEKITHLMRLVFRMISLKMILPGRILVRISYNHLQFRFKISDQGGLTWKNDFSRGNIESSSGFGFASHALLYAFSKVLESESEFLSRTDDGLGSEILLIHQLMKLHQGQLSYKFLGGGEIQLTLEFPKLQSQQALDLLLNSRTNQVTRGLGSVLLVVLKVPKKSQFQRFFQKIRRLLFRTTDQSYALPQSNEIVLVLDDCKPESHLVLLERIKKRGAIDLPAGAAYCPDDGLSAQVLFQIARRRLNGR